MKRIQINGRLGLKGNDIPFVNEDFFGLKVGSMITKIGNGKENGTIRTDNFTTPVKYVGSVIVDYSEPEKMYAFEWCDKIEDESIFLLYGTTGFEIFTEQLYSKKTRDCYVRFYKPEFK